MKILFVEDDKFIAIAYRGALTREGFDVTNAYDGVEAAELLKGQSFDLIVIDLVLPYKSGFEILSELKIGQKGKKSKIIVLTNLNQEADKKKAMDLGADMYLVQSDHTLKEVVAQIKQLLASS